ncbi:MAG: RNA polymerase subunit sigma, partial [Christensenellaceae bacterium]|nr:RNA polymerase subunit sigma [Christensenellaceae bacterium]
DCPRQQRTLLACRKVLAFAIKAGITERVAKTGKLPIGELALAAGVEKKTLERHRRYLVAIMVAYTNGYEVIRAHLCQVHPQKGGENV